MKKDNITNKYNEYVKKFKYEGTKFNMQDMYTKEEFTKVYRDLVKQQSTKVSERDGGTESIIHGKLVNFMVQSQRLGSYEVAAEQRRDAIEMAKFGSKTGKISKSQMPKITFFTKPDLSQWIGKVVEGVNKKGMKYKYTMSATNAYFAYMNAIGRKEEAEAEYGY